MQKPTLKSSATMLITSSVRRSAEFYRDKLGFEIDFVYEGRVSNQPNYAVVKRNDLEVHFESYEHDSIDDPEPRVKCGIYFMVDDVDSLYREFVERDVIIKWPPTDQSYGIRDLKVLDCDGYQLLFGSPIAVIRAEPSHADDGVDVCSESNSRSAAPDA